MGLQGYQMKTLLEIFYPAPPKTEILIIRVSADVKRKAQELAKADGRSVSSYVRNLIEQASK
jgi:predicted HicB family RNase H-like nuclease